MIDYEIRRGRLTRDPEIRYTPKSNLPVVHFTIAQSDAKWDQASNRWDSQRELFINVNVWDDSRGNNSVPWTQWCSEFLHKGSSVVVHGKFVTRSWTTKQGDTRHTTDFTADEVYLSLRDLGSHDTPARGSSTGGFSSTNTTDGTPPF